MTLIKVLLVGLLFFFALTFSMQNDLPVEIRYWGLTESLKVPLYVVVLFCFFSGVIIGGLGGLVSNFRLKWELKRIKRELERLRSKEGPPPLH